ncbi:hypothetical protein N656DRAFT_731328 [Canariomyces notabilis]|uniref:Zn(2)-C6 fungal-type domain-containing protein n=1 Tax=Canariomyces notabilis TaxID=2074819 RepID=A0AAN6YSV2_9PEZI|nr:hypothetical protein N656DRAFT_731328 [Canariomyces arenarius]
MDDPDAIEYDDCSPPATAVHHTRVPRACDACRVRKIRCDRESPCAHCVQSKIECTQSKTRQREKRTRVLLSRQYENKIDSIDRRLGAVVGLLEELRTKLPSRTPASSGGASTTKSSPLNPVTAISHGSHATPISRASPAGISGPVVEGESSLTAHSAFAKDLLQKVVSKESRPEFRERIDDLHHMVEVMKLQPAADEMAYPLAKPMSLVVRGGCQLPPIEKTLEVLKLAKCHSQHSIAWIFELFKGNNFPETCLSVHMADEYEYHTPRFTIGNALLHYLFLTYSYVIPEKRDDYLGMSRICATNIETALSNLPLHLPASEDMITALCLGVFTAVELAKASLAWTLSSKASELCQALGYHRIGTYKNSLPDDAERKQTLFWIVYTLDKSLSLRLGRSSTIQEYDITLPGPREDGPGVRPKEASTSAWFDIWVSISRLHGQIYELLYCPEALAQPREVREFRMQLLVGRLDQLDALTYQTRAAWVNHSKNVLSENITDFVTLSDDVLHLSTRTLILRAVPNPAGCPTTFTETCIQAAQDTLARHQECMAVIERTRDPGMLAAYMNWTILYAPFVPFIVLFCHVIETKDSMDLGRLEAFNASVQPHHATSEAVDKLRHLFQILYSVAAQYVHSVGGGGSREEQQANQVDPPLAALFPFHAEQLGPGSLPDQMGGHNNQLFQRGVNPMIWMSNEAQLENWLYNKILAKTLEKEAIFRSSIPLYALPAPSIQR